MDPQQKAVAEEFDAYRDNYSDAVNDALAFSGLRVDFFTRVKADYIGDLLARNFEAPDRVRMLDIGCGVGNYHGRLSRMVAELHGVDVSASCIETARRTHPDVNYASYDGTRLPFEDASFDAAVTICVLHHVPVDAWTHFVSEMMRILRPGGMAMIFEHNPVNPLTMRVVNSCPFDKDAVLLKASRTMTLFREAGFDAVEKRFILSVPSANAALRRVDGLFSFAGLGAQYYVTGKRHLERLSA